MSGYLLDTNVIIDWLRGQSQTIAWLVHHAQTGTPLYISGITVAELFAGFADEEMQMRDGQLSAFRFLPLTYRIARVAGELSRQHRQSGSSIPVPDLIQAASALVHGLTVSTSNRVHFLNVATVDPRTSLV